MTVEPARHTTWLLEAFLKAGQLAGFSLHDPNSFEASDGFGQKKSGSGQVWVPKKLGFPRVLGFFGIPTTSLLMGSGSKKVRFSPRVFRYPNPSLFLNQKYLSCISKHRLGVQIAIIYIYIQMYFIFFRFFIMALPQKLQKIYRITVHILNLLY